MQYQPMSTASGRELDPRAGDAVATIHVPTSSTFYERAIEGLTLLDEEILAQSNFPPIYESGVVYRKEAADTWRHADDVFCSGWGDCEDLAAWRAAELRVSGEDPDARVYVYRSGKHRFHAVVARGNGRVEDPSLILGMPVSPERRAKMPKWEGDTEMQDVTPRQFAVCRGPQQASGCASCAGADYGYGADAGGIDEDLVGEVPSCIGSDQLLTDEVMPPRRYRRRRLLRRAFAAGEVDQGFGPGQYADDYGDEYGDGYGDEYGDDYGDESMYDEVPPSPPPRRPAPKRRETKFQKAWKWGVEKPTRLATKLAYHSIATPLKGLKKISSFLVGFEDDEDYEDGDEDVFDEYDDDEEIFDEDVPDSQRVRFSTDEVSPGVWQGQVKIPTEGGRALTMKTSAAPSEKAAAERMMNLAKRAANTPALQLALNPAAFATMAAIRAAGPTGQAIKSAARTIGRFVRVQW